MTRVRVWNFFFFRGLFLAEVLGKHPNPKGGLKMNAYEVILDHSGHGLTGVPPRRIKNPVSLKRGGGSQ